MDIQFHEKNGYLLAFFVYPSGKKFRIPINDYQARFLRKRLDK